MNLKTSLITGALAAALLGLSGAAALAAPNMSSQSIVYDAPHGEQTDTIDKGDTVRVSKCEQGFCLVTDLDDLVSEPVSRVIIRDPDATAEDFVTLAKELGLQGTDYVVGWTAWLDLAPVGVSKASGLAYVAEQLGVDAADVLAIGDGRNDIEMLQWSGRGVAMGQAVQQVLDAADDVTATVAEDGAAVELGRYF